MAYDSPFLAITGENLSDVEFFIFLIFHHGKTKTPKGQKKIKKRGGKKMSIIADLYRRADLRKKNVT